MTMMTHGAAAVRSPKKKRSHQNNNNTNKHNKNEFIMFTVLRWALEYMGTMLRAMLFGRQAPLVELHAKENADRGNRLGDTTNLAQLAMTSTLDPLSKSRHGHNAYRNSEEDERSHQQHGLNESIDHGSRRGLNDSRSSILQSSDDDESAFDKYNSPIKGNFDPNMLMMTPEGTYKQTPRQGASPYHDDASQSSSGDDSSQRRIGELRYLNEDYDSYGEEHDLNFEQDHFSSSDDDSSFEEDHHIQNGEDYNYNAQNQLPPSHQYDEGGHIVLDVAASHSEEFDQSKDHANGDVEELHLPPDFQHGVVYVPHARQHQHQNQYSNAFHQYSNHHNHQHNPQSQSQHEMSMEVSFSDIDASPPRTLMGPQGLNQSSLSLAQSLVQDQEDPHVIPTGSYQTNLPNHSNICSTELSRMLQAQHWDNAIEYCKTGKFRLRDIRTKVDVHIPKLGKCQTLPLHLACLYQPPVEVIQALVDLFPEAASLQEDTDELEDDEVSSCNQLPIHLACMLGASAGVLKVLLDTYPLAVKCRESFGGFLPLHLAVHSTTTNLEAIEVLIKAFPESLHVVCNFGDTPLDIIQKGSRKDQYAVKCALQAHVDKLPPPIEVRHLIQDIGSQRVGGGSNIHLLGSMKLKHFFPKNVPSSVRKSTKTVETFIRLSVPARPSGSTGEKEWQIVYQTDTFGMSTTISSSELQVLPWTLANAAENDHEDEVVDLEYLASGHPDMRFRIEVLRQSRKGDQEDDVLVGAVETTLQKMLAARCSSDNTDDPMQMLSSQQKNNIIPDEWKKDALDILPVLPRSGKDKLKPVGQLVILDAPARQ